MPRCLIPVSVLIESQYLACKSHAKRHKQKKDANDPSKFSGKLVGSEQEHLHHVDQDDRDHEVRAPAVQRSYKPTQSDAMIKGLQTVPCLSCEGT